MNFIVCTHTHIYIYIHTWTQNRTCFNNPNCTFPDFQGHCTRTSRFASRYLQFSLRLRYAMMFFSNGRSLSFPLDPRYTTQEQGQNIS